MNNADLKHRDWLLKTQQALAFKSANDISSEIISTPNGGKQLWLKYVDEQCLENLQFLTNTDQNNNYLYLEGFEIITEGTIYPLDFPGLKETMIKIFEISDSNSFLNSEKIHQPFLGPIFGGNTMSEYIDAVSALLPFMINTYGIKKYYNLVLNPDVINQRQILNPDVINQRQSKGLLVETGDRLEQLR